MGWFKNLLGLGDDPATAKARKLMKQDQHDARRRFVFGVLGISYKVDPGYLTEHSVKAVRDWYGLGTREELITRIQEYSQPGADNQAYDSFLASFLARAGYGIGWLGEEESWSLAFDAARQVQQHYPSWADYGRGYLAGQLAYRAKQGDDEARLSEIRENVTAKIANHDANLWAQTPFNTQL